MQNPSASGTAGSTARERRLPALLFGLVLLLCLPLAAVELRELLGPGFGANDFSVFWAAGRFALQQPLAGAYDPATFQAFKQTLGQPGLSPLPLNYPPPTVLLFAPLGLLPPHAAELLWSAVTLALFLLAAWFALRPARLLPLAALLAPAGMINLAGGQTGFLIAAIAACGWLLLPRRPWLGGMVLGLLALKPQLALLPLALLPFCAPLAATAGAALSMAALATASVATFGLAPWLAWLHALLGFGGGLANSSAHLRFGTSVSFALLDLGLPAGAALALQLLAAALVFATALGALRRAGPALATALVLCGMGLVTPYTALYDLPAASIACLVLAAAGWRGHFAAGEPLALLVVWCVPLLALLPRLPPHLPALSVAALALLYALLLRRTRAVPA